MGLCDEVRCEYPLPNRAHQGLNFQTKDLESLMDRYVITKRGRLVRKRHRGLIRKTRRDIMCPIDQDLRIYASVEVGLEHAAEIVGPKLWRSAAVPARTRGTAAGPKLRAKGKGKA